MRNQSCVDDESSVSGRSGGESVGGFGNDSGSRDA